MKRIFELINGEIVFENDLIIMSDYANKLRCQILLRIGLLTVAGGCFICFSIAQGNLSLF